MTYSLYSTERNELILFYTLMGQSPYKMQSSFATYANCSSLNTKNKQQEKRKLLRSRKKILKTRKENQGEL